MLQRSIADEGDPARGTWEFPGGEVEQGESPRQGAVREWQEETGATLPAGEFVGQWKDGIYEGFVYVVPSEKDVPLKLDGDDRLICNPDDPDCDDSETLAWWAPSDARKNPALRAAVKGSDWRAIDAAVPDAVFKSLPILVIHKDAPTATDVHVDVPLGSDPKKKRRKKGEPAEPELSVYKADDEARVVYGIVLEPDVEDSQGDVVSKEDVELAAHRYLYQQGLAIGDQHRKMAPNTVRPVESYIAPCDFELGGQVVKAGSWVLAAHVPDDNLWEQIKKGHKGAWSVGGSGKRSELVETVAKDEAPNVPPIHVHVNIGEGAIPVNPVIHNHMPEHGEHTVNVHVPEQAAPVVHNHVAPAEAPAVTLEHHTHVETPQPKAVRVETAEDGTKRYVPE